MIVGEAWGEWEERKGAPFVGPSGDELNRLLHDAGLTRNECYVTNVVNSRPPGNDIQKWMPEAKKDITPDCVQVRGKFVKPIVAEGIASLQREIALVKPAVILALGGTALWALTEHEGITKWRGSLLQYHGDACGAASRVVPTYHPAAILRMWEWRAIALLDFKRAARELVQPTVEPSRRYLIGLNLSDTILTLGHLFRIVQTQPLWVDLDLETKAGHIDCCGLSWSPTDAICIPFMSDTNMEGYWTVEEEAQVLWWLMRLTRHPNCWIRGQNILYDCQYTWRHWHFVPNVKQDTMISHHTLWAGLPKSLAFQASMYCDYYVNWKPDKEVWKEGG